MVSTQTNSEDSRGISNIDYEQREGSVSMIDSSLWKQGRDLHAIKGNIRVLCLFVTFPSKNRAFQSAIKCGFRKWPEWKTSLNRSDHICESEGLKQPPNKMKFRPNHSLAFFEIVKISSCYELEKKSRLTHCHFTWNFCYFFFFFFLSTKMKYSLWHLLRENFNHFFKFAKYRLFWSCEIIPALWSQLHECAQCNTGGRFFF